MPAILATALIYAGLKRVEIPSYRDTSPKGKAPSLVRLPPSAALAPDWVVERKKGSGVLRTPSGGKLIVSLLTQPANVPVPIADALRKAKRPSGYIQVGPWFGERKRSASGDGEKYDLYSGRRNLSIDVVSPSGKAAAECRSVVRALCASLRS